ncbi:MAG: DUF1214 domain-containing protein [Actinobacteria bacterium]|nr:DUF1214 domain-containing protein [Actinomycetota bacterium]
MDAEDSGWADLLAAIGELPRLLADVPDHERPEGMRYLLRFLAAGIRICIEADDADAPMLTRSIEHRMSWGLDNPDTTYLYTRLDPGGRYRLRGTRGSARHLEIQVNTGHQGDGDFAGWQATWWRSGDDLDDPIDIEIPPTEDASFLLVRQYFSDWMTEEPATLDIGRVDTTLPPAPLDALTLAARLDLLRQWLRTGGACWDQLARGLLGSLPEESSVWEVQPFLPPEGASGLKGQAYGMGPWTCAPDEAVIVELEPPHSRYWSVSLCDRFWQSIDFAQRQSSLNDSQAEPGADGRYVFVISHGDPRVANWLDPGNRTAGTIAVRYLFPEGDRVPPVRLRRLPRQALEEHLSADEPRVDTDERQRRLRERQAAVAARLRW